MSAFLACLGCGGPPKIAAGSLKNEPGVRAFWACNCGLLVRMTATVEEGLEMMKEAKASEPARR